MTVTPINPLVLAYTQPDGQSRNPGMDFRPGTLVAGRRGAEAQDSLDLSRQGLELSRAADLGRQPGAVSPLPEAPIAKAEPRPSLGLDLLT